MNMTEVSVVGVIVAKLVGLWWYFRLMKQGKVDPALSTWIILTIITGLSLWTYSNAEHNDFRAGILNTVDVFSNFSVVLALLFLSKHGVRFKKLEQWYLVGIASIIGYGLVTGSAWGANVMTQLLLVGAYVPTLYKIFTNKKSSDSYMQFGMGIVCALFALYPAFISEGNTLSSIYVWRSMLSCLVVMLLMGYYDLKQWRKNRVR